MGLTTWEGDKPRKPDVAIAKNYLSEKELEVLNRIVTFYLEFAELQALDRKPMYMRDWITKLDDFVKLGGRELLNHAGTISHDQALEKAHAEYEAYRKQQLNVPSPVEKHFLEAVQEVKEIEVKLKRKKKKSK